MKFVDVKFIESRREAVIEKYNELQNERRKMEENLQNVKSNLSSFEGAIEAMTICIDSADSSLGNTKGE